MHVLDGHPEMRLDLEHVLGVVTDPGVITPDAGVAGRWCYWRRNVGPSRWLFVVVEWDAPQPHVVTAYGKRKDPL
jgi:hypothetical protein